MELESGGGSTEARGGTVEEAVAAAARELGRSPEDLDVEVLEEPRRGVFGRRSARVRVTARTAAGEGPQAGPPSEAPEATADRPTSDRSERSEDGPDDVAADPEETRASAGAREAATPDASSPTRPKEQEEDPVTDTTANEASEQSQSDDVEELSPEERLDQLDEEAEIAADFIEGLLDILSLPGDIEIVVREEQALVNINEVGSGLLIGRRGATLDALQELVRCATQRRTERRAHVRVDVEGYRERQLEKLREKCRDAIAEVREHGEPVRLEPMDPYERKMMHDVVAKASGVTSTSEGNEPRRRVVIHPAED